jgi:hypothetical protein
MATSSDLNTLSGLAKCFRCLSDAEARALTVYLLDQIAQGSGGGGGGGGAVTIADGADVTQGAKADAANINPAAGQSQISAIKGILATLTSGIAISQGNVGGFTTVIKSVSVVTAAAYSAGNAVGAKRTLASAVRSSGGTGILQSVTLLDRANQKAAMTLFIFDADPTAATITDKAAFVFSTDDLKVIAQVNIGAGDYVTTNGKAIALISGLQIPLQAASGTSLYAALVTTGTPTFAATTDVQLEFGIMQD